MKIKIPKFAKYFPHNCQVFIHPTENLILLKFIDCRKTLEAMEDILFQLGTTKFLNCDERLFMDMGLAELQIKRNKLNREISTLKKATLKN